MEYDELLSRLKKVERKGNKATALCPAHRDKKPSLSISLVGKKILLHCHAGCEPESIVSAIDLEMPDLFTDSDSTPFRAEVRRKPPTALEVGASTGNPTDWKVKAVYDYTDESGAVLYYKERLERDNGKKSFRQYRTDGNGAKVYNLDGVRRVPYNLKDLAKVREASGFLKVFLVEGEKDSDNLKGLHAENPLIARGVWVSSLKGWEETFNANITGAEVFIFRDHDSSGRKQADKAARIVSEVAKSVKVIDLFPDSPEKGQDVTDWIELLKREEGIDEREIQSRLLEIVRDAPIWQRHGQITERRSIFIKKTASQWLEDAKATPTPKKLFGEFWYEGEVCIFFADSNQGKSILAVQIGEAIAKGGSISGIEMEASARKVIYLDFELSPKQFELRYSQSVMNSEFRSKHYLFSDNFIRLQIDRSIDANLLTNFEDVLKDSLRGELESDEAARVFIIDNLTFFDPKAHEPEKAFGVMQFFNELSDKYGASFLLISHAVKRDQTRPISSNDLSGSAKMVQVCDSCFAMGRSKKGKGLRYLKQIKVRNAEHRYTSDSVLLCKIEGESNFLQFNFEDVGFPNPSPESHHLETLEQFEKSKESALLTEKIRELRSDGKTVREIAEMTGKSVGTISNKLKNLERAETMGGMEEPACPF